MLSQVPNNPHALVIRYLRKEQGFSNPQGELYIAAQGPKKDVSRMLDAVRGRDELMFALRAMREEPEDRMASGDPAAIEVDIPHSSDDSPKGPPRYLHGVPTRLTKFFELSKCPRNYPRRSESI